MVRGGAELSWLPGFFAEQADHIADNQQAASPSKGQPFGKEATPTRLPFRASHLSELKNFAPATIGSFCLPPISLRRLLAFAVGVTLISLSVIATHFKKFSREISSVGWWEKIRKNPPSDHRLHCDCRNANDDG